MRTDRTLNPRGVEDGDPCAEPLVELIGPGKRILDLDGVPEGFARTLAFRSCAIVTLESTADLNRDPLHTIVGASRFDVVLMTKTLERVRDPRRVLEEARALLLPNGYVIASVSNASHGAIRLNLLQGRTQAERRLFTARTVEQLFLSAGYAIETIERVTVKMLEPHDDLPQVDADLLSDDLRLLIAEDRDFETLRFLVRAHPLSDTAYHRLLMRSVVSLSDALHDLQVEVKSHVRALASSRAELLENRKLLADADREMHFAQDRAEEVERELLNARRRIDALTEESIAARADAERFAAEAGDEREAVALSREKHRALKVERDALSAELGALDAEMSAFAGANNELLARVSGLERERDDLCNQRDELRELVVSYKETKARLAEVEQRLRGEKALREAAEQRVGAVSREFLRHVERSIESVDARSAELESALHAIQQGRFWRLKRFLRRSAPGR